MMTHAYSWFLVSNSYLLKTIEIYYPRHAFLQLSHVGKSYRYKRIETSVERTTGNRGAKGH